MRRQFTMKARLTAFALAAAAFAMTGCTDMSVLSSGPTPRVEDCALVGQSTPSKFVCGDSKTYTAVQLADIRAGKAAK
jgi:hypothetical protein